eukprot:752477-Hanusia_phi.AAC.1
MPPLRYTHPKSESTTLPYPTQTLLLHLEGLVGRVGHRVSALRGRGPVPGVSPHDPVVQRG